MTLDGDGGQIAGMLCEAITRRSETTVPPTSWGRVGRIDGATLWMTLMPFIVSYDFDWHSCRVDVLIGYADEPWAALRPLASLLSVSDRACYEREMRVGLATGGLRGMASQIAASVHACARLGAIEASRAECSA